MSNENRKATKNNKKYAILAIVVILVAFGLMRNNSVEETTTVATTEQASVAKETTIARIDISTPLVNADEPQFEVYVDGSEEPLKEQASWMPQYNSQGYSVQKQDGNEINIKIKALNTAKITISLRGIWDRGADGNLIKHPITYTAFQINNENILTEPQTVWFAEPYEQSIDVKNGDEIIINVNWSNVQ